MLSRVYKRFRDLKFASSFLGIAFILGIIIGFNTSKADTEGAKALFSMIKQLLKPLLLLKGWRLVLGIYLNNLRVCSLLFLISIISPFSLAFLGLFANGFIVGLVLWISNGKTHNMLQLLISLLPHGVLELPAVILAASTGSIIGLELVRFFIGKIGWIDQRKLDIPKNIWFWAVAIIFLLIPAAIIEVFVSPLLLHYH